MINLALKSVLYDWRRYLPIAVVIGISGLMIVVQAALSAGTISLTAAPVRLSQADLWVGPVDAMALDQSRGISPFSVGKLWLDTDILRVEAYNTPSYVMIGENEEAGIFGEVIALDTSDGSMTLARAISLNLRRKLAEPGTVVLNRFDARKLNIALEDRLEVNDQSLRVVGIVDGVRSVFGVQLVVSGLTSRTLLQSGDFANEKPSFYIVKLRPSADAKTVAARLTDVFPLPEYRVWLSEDLAKSTVWYWAMETGAGTQFMASSAIALVVALMVVSQTLSTAVAGTMREYAALRAYGIRFDLVRGIAIKQGAYVCLTALMLTAVVSSLVLWVLRWRGVAVELPFPLALVVAVALAITVVISNLFALRHLRHIDPASLLR